MIAAVMIYQGESPHARKSWQVRDSGKSCHSRDYLIKGFLAFMYLQRYLDLADIISNDGLFLLPRLNEGSLVKSCCVSIYCLF